MSDIPGLFVMVICLYCCLRALQAQTSRAATLWILTATAASALGGTARQTAWLGAIVMVPTVIWMLHHKRLPRLLLGAAWLLSLVFMWASMRWFAHHPYSLVEGLASDVTLAHNLFYAFPEHSLRTIFDAGLYLLPVLVAVVAWVDLRSRRVRVFLIVTGAFLLLGSLYLAHGKHLDHWLAPWLGNTVTYNGMVNIPEIGTRPAMFNDTARSILSIVSLVPTIAAIAFLLALPGRRPEPAAEQEETLSLRDLSILILPFALAYLLMMLHRAIFDQVFDRYLLPLLFVVLIFVGRFYQERVAPKLPRYCLVPLVIFALFGIAGNHDLFAMQRARLQAAAELEHDGIPRDEIYGGFEFDGWTQVDRYGFVNSGAMNTPRGFTADRPIPIPEGAVAPCNDVTAALFPAVHPRYGLSFDEISCDGPSKYPAVAYRSWLPPYGGKIYIRKVMGPTQ
jgi:hypothetical protein